MNQPVPADPTARRVEEARAALTVHRPLTPDEYVERMHGLARVERKRTMRHGGYLAVGWLAYLASYLGVFGDLPLVTDLDSPMTFFVLFSLGGLSVMLLFSAINVREIAREFAQGEGMNPLTPEQTRALANDIAPYDQARAVLAQWLASSPAVVLRERDYWVVREFVRASAAHESLRCALQALTTGERMPAAA